MIVVSNTTPILSLYKIGKLKLLQSLFGQVIVPMAVYDEIAVAGKGKQGYDELEKVDYILIKEIKNVFAANILRSQETIGAYAVINIDDGKSRKSARGAV